MRMMTFFIARNNDIARITMTVSNLSAAAPQAAWQQNAEQFKQSFDALGSAIQSGDLSSAQDALTSLQQSQPANASNKANISNGPLSKDWAALQQALQSNDPNAAKQAFTQLQTDMKALHKGHHHHAKGANAAAANAPASSQPDDSSDKDASSGPSVSVVA